MRPSNPITIAVLAAALGAAAPMAAAQSTQTGPEVEALTTYDEATLRSFAGAAVEVREIVERYRPDLEGAETEADRQAVAQEVNAAMRQAVVDAEGIDIETYVEIARAAQKNDVLAKRITRYMRES